MEEEKENLGNPVLVLKKNKKKKHVDMWCMQTAQHKALCIGADASGRNVLTPEVVI